MEKFVLTSDNISSKHIHMSKRTFTPKRVTGFLMMAVLSLLTLSVVAQGVQKLAFNSPASKDSYSNLLKKTESSIYFKENKGQWEPGVLAQGHTNVGEMVVKKDQLYFLSTKKTEGAEGAETTPAEPINKAEEAEEGFDMHGWAMSFDGYNPNFTVAKSNELPTKYNYFMDTDPTHWATNVSSFGEITLQNVYKGIDLRLYSQKSRHIEFDWLVGAGADYHNIKMRFKGQDGLSVDEKGNLVVKLHFDDVKFDIPEAYQLINGSKVAVKLKFKVEGGVARFETTDKIDSRYPLIIDPSLKWGIWMDDNTDDFDEYLFSVDVDNSGNVYCGGNVNVKMTASYGGSPVFGYQSSSAYVQGTSGNGNNRAGLIYEIANDGSAILRETYYCGSATSSGQNAIYGLSLSPDKKRVFVCGYTHTDLPMSTLHTPFDNTRTSDDGYVAVFPWTLDTLVYSTYIGSDDNNTNERMVSIRALSNFDFVVGGRISSALGASYISNAYDNSYSGGLEMYVAKFTGFTNLTFGTYCGGTGNDDLNDIAVSPLDGSVIFTGYSANRTSFPGLINAVGYRDSTHQEAVLGVIPSAGGTFSMLSRIGGNGTNSFQGITLGLLDTIYVTGYTTATDFPLGTGADTSNRFRFNASTGGNNDGLIGKTPKLGRTGANDPWMATYFGGTGDDQGNTIRTYAQSTALMVFGETQSDNFPTQNLNLGGNTFYSNTRQGGWDIFWIALSTNLKQELFATYVGGTGNDYLGETGVPAGSNHFVVEGDSLIVLGTTSHSTTSLVPTVIGPAGTVFDATNSSNGDDVHLVFKWRIGAIFSYDFGDAPRNYGLARHTIFNTLKIGSLEDAEDFYPATPGTKSNVDDNTTSDDEDGISGTQVMIQDTATRYSVTIPVTNNTGNTAKLFGFIDFNRDGVFDSSSVELASVSVPNGATSATLTWTGFNFSTLPLIDTSYMRIRLTTDAAFAGVSQPSPGGNALDGEVEDYLVIRYHCVNLTGALIDTTNPTTCGASNGTITISNGNLIPGTTYEVTYKKNGGATQGPFPLTPNNSGTVVITGLGAGTYSVVQIFHPTNPACGFTLPNVITLKDPTPPAAPTITVTPNDTICVGGSFTISATGPGGAIFHWTGPNSFNFSGATRTFTNATTTLSGTYSVVDSIGNCVSSPSTVAILVSPNPTITASTSTPTVCTGGTINLSSSPSGGSGVYSTFSWSGPTTFSPNNVQNPSISPATTAMTGAYSVTVTDSRGCTATAGNVNVSVSPSINVTVGSNSPVCAGGTLSLTTTVTGNTGTPHYSWAFSGGGFAPGDVANPTRSPATTAYQGTYSVTVTAANNCSATGSTNVIVNNQISVSAGSNSVVCNGATLILTATPTGGSGTINYSWSGPGGYTAAVQSPTRANATTAMNGTYTVSVSDANTCTASATTSVTVDPALNASAGSTQTVCSGTTVTLGGSPTASGGTGSGTYTYVWSGGAASTSNPSVTVSSTTTFTVTVTDGALCTATASKTVNVNQPPTVDAGADKALSTCSPTGITIGGSPTASGNGPFNYAWTPTTGLTTATSANPNVQGIGSSTTYTVVVTDANLCTASDQVNVNVSVNSPSVNIVAGGPTQWCAGSGGSVNLTANVGTGTSPFTYAWNGSNLSPLNAQIATANPNTANTYTYTVTVTDAFNCTVSASATVTVNANPTASAGPGGGFNVCIGSAVTIGGSPTASGGTPGYTYSWTSGAAPVANPSVSPVSNTSYTVTVTDSKNCTASSTTSVSVHSLPHADAGADQTIPACSVIGTTIGGSPAGSAGQSPYTYSWSPITSLSSSTASNPNVVGLGTTTLYTLVVTDANQCTASDQVQVNVTSGSSLSVAISPSGPLTWCEGSGGSVSLTAIISNGAGSNTEQWTGVNLSVDTGTLTTASPTAAGTYVYSVQVTDGTGCQASSSVSVTVYPHVTASAGPVTDTVCNGQSVTLGGSPTATGGTSPFSYSWTNGAAATANPSISPSGTTTYTVIVTDAHNCTASAASTVVIRTNPTADAGQDKTLPTCSPSGVQIGGAPTATGGSGAPFTYAWLPTTGLSASNVANPTVVGIGSSTTYTVTVTDKNGCTSSDAVLVTSTNNSPTVSITASGSTEWCANTNGSVTFTAGVSNGTGPFAYNWSGSNLTPNNVQIVTANPSVGGSYTYGVTVTDAFNCTTSATRTVIVDSVPRALAGGVTGAPIICSGFNVSIGGVPSTASGGTPPYTYSWSGGANSVASPTVSPTSTTTYSVTVTDAHSCTATANTTVTVRPKPTANAGPDVNLPACSPTGIQIGGSPTASGGVPGYTYAWSPTIGLSASNISNPTVAGIPTDTTYTVTVTDANGCFASDAVHVHLLSTSPTVSISSSNTPEWCAGTFSSTNLTANVSNGNVPFTYSWSGTNINPTNSQTATVNPNTAGTYTYNVTITDAANCTASATKTITVDSVPRANAGAGAGGFVTCNGTPVTIGGSPTAAGGTPPYNYSWSGGAAGVSNPSVTPSSTTTYNVTVTDSKGCTATASVGVTVNPLPHADAGLDQFITTCTADSVTIGGSPSGSLGNPPYTYAWSPSTGLSSTTASNPVVKGISTTQTYTLTVTDFNGCSATDAVVVRILPSSLSVNAGPDVQLCAGFCAQLGTFPPVSGGSAPFTYSWSGGNLTDPSAANPVACPNGTTTYTVSVTDSKGCTATDAVIVTVNPNPTADAGPDLALCSGNSVTIGGNPAASGGTAPYTYSWNPTQGLSRPDTSNPVATPAITTTYQLIVIDSKGCTNNDQVTVTPRPNPIANAGPDKGLTSCSGDTIYIGDIPAATGGTPGYTYTWTPSNFLSCTNCPNPRVTGLTVTTSYQLLVTDTFGCQSADFVTVNALPTTLQADAGSNRSICSNLTTAIQIGGAPTATGGTSPYSYNWFPTAGLSNSGIANPLALPAVTTTYYVTVTDLKGCQSVDSIKITVNQAPQAFAGRDTALCAGFCVTLGATPPATGGNGVYQYLWGPTVGLNTNNIAHPLACPGVTTAYVLTVTDGNGCSATSNVRVSINPNPVASAGPTSVTLVGCAGDSVKIGGAPTASGGTPGYTYSWTPTNNLSCTNCPNPYVSGLGANQLYSVLVTDANGCTAAAATNVIVSSNNLTADAGNDVAYCSNSNSSVALGGSPTATGGTPAYTYTWSPSLGNDPHPVVSPTVTTTYHLTVTDSKGCIAVDSVKVTVRQSPIVNAGNDTTICSLTDITLGGDPTATGGGGAYQYQWAPVTGIDATASNPVVTPATTTTYTVTVTDRIGCSATGSVIITVNPVPVAHAGNDQNLVACSSDSVQLGDFPAATGGNGVYTYSWLPAGGLSCSNCPNPFASHLGSTTTYTLVVTDSNGCSSSSDNVTVFVSNSSLVAHAGNNVSFCQGTPVSVTLGSGQPAVGGTPPYTYTWSPNVNLSSTSSPNPIASPTTSTTYFLVVTDANGCIASDSVRITINPRPVVSAGSADTVCVGSTVTLGGSPTGSGGTGPLTYSWSPTLFFNTSTTIANPTVTPTSNVTYGVTVTDSLGCSSTGSVSVVINPNPVANAGSNQSVVACPQACVILGGSPTGNGGTPPFTYNWSPSTGISSISASNPKVCGINSSGTYTVTITDSHGCTATSSVFITVVPSGLTVDAGLEQHICSGQTTSVTLGGNPTAQGGQTPYTYTWAPAGGLTSPSNVSNPTADPRITTKYFVDVIDVYGCEATDSVTVIVSPSVTASVNADTAVCSGNSLVIGGSPTGSGGTAPLSYNWSPGTGLSRVDIANPTATPISSSVWCVTVTDSVGCSASACQSVTVNPVIHADAGPDQTITNCPGSFVQIGGSPTASGGSGNYTYSWSPSIVGGVTVLSPTASNPIVTGLTITTHFHVTVTDVNTGCTGTDEVVITIVPSNLTANAGGTKVLCANSSGCVTLGGANGIATATGGSGPYIYQWSPISGLNDPTNANPCASPTSTTVYHLTVTDQLGCTAQDSATIFVSPRIVVDAGTNSTICSQQSFDLGGNPTATGGIGTLQYNWAGTNLSCSSCPNPVAQTVTVNGQYSVTVTDSLGCSATGAVQVAVRPLPRANAGLDATIFACAADSVVIGGTPTATGTQGPYTYSWAPPLNISLSCLNCPNPTVRNLGFQTDFTVTVTDAFGCTASDDVVVTVLPNTVVVNAGNQNVPTICSNIGGCVTLGNGPTTVTGGTPPYTYQWSGGTVSDPSIPTPQACPIQTTTYLLVGTDAHGCQASDTARVTVNLPPVVSLSGLPATICVNAGNITLVGSPTTGGTGTFSGPGVTGNLFQPSAVGPGRYCITYTFTSTATGCTNDTTVCVSVVPLPVLSITGANASYCQSDTPITLVGTPAGGTFSGSGINGNVFSPGSANVGNDVITYSYTDPITNCSNTTTITITIKPSPQLTIAASTDTSCAGGQVTFTPTQYSNDVFNVIWTKVGGGNIGGGLNPITVTTPGATPYCVAATAVNTAGCSVSDTLCVVVNQPPVLHLDTIHTCEQQPVTINFNQLVSDPQGNTDSFTITVPPTRGTITYTGNGVYVYTPTNYYFGLDSFYFNACSEVCPTNCTSGKVYVSICFTNWPPPIANPINLTTCDKQPIGVNVSSATTDSLGHTLTFSYGTIVGPAGASWTVTGHGAGVFTAATAGLYIIPYTVCDNVIPAPNYCASNRITILVTDCDSIHSDTIRANDDVAVVHAGNSITIPELNNDHYPSPGSLNVSVISGPHLLGSSFSFNGNNIIYNSSTPGVDSITYVICDPAPLCDTATIYITVDTLPGATYPNDSINANNDGVVVHDSVWVNINELANDYYPYPGSLNVSIIVGPHLPGAQYNIGSNGTINYNSPTPGEDSIVYVICDPAPLCDTATIYIFVDSSKHGIIVVPPVAVDDYDTTRYITAITIPVLHNDHDPNGDSIILTSIPCTPGSGTAVINANGTITYTPNSTANALNADTFCYVICDYLIPNLCDTATVVVNIRPSVFAINDTVTTTSIDPINIDVKRNDWTPENDSFWVIQLITTGTVGTVSINPNGTVHYVPKSDTCGFVDSFQYVDYTVLGAMDTATVFINVQCPHIKPVAMADTEYVCKGDTINISPFLNDTVQSGLSLYISGIGTMLPPSLGIITRVDSVITFISTGITGVVRFEYYECDNGTPQKCDTGNITIYINNCPHVQVDTIYDTTFVNTPDTICVGGYVHATGSWIISQICNPQNGTVVINDSCFTYTPNTGFFGNDTFCIVVCDSLGCTTSEVIITVLDTIIKAVPEACDMDTAIMNTPLKISELANDIIPLAGDTVVTLQSTPVNGTAVVNADHTITYTPNKDYTGTEQFSYMVCAVTGSYRYCDTAEICVTVVDTAIRCFIPNAFSPNGDGINDKFVIPCNDENPKATLKIFDRWGVQVWASNGHYNNDWDGRNQGGTQCPDGTYYAIYEYNDGVTKNQEKFVVIHR